MPMQLIFLIQEFNKNHHSINSVFLKIEQSFCSLVYGLLSFFNSIHRTCKSNDKCCARNTSSVSKKLIMKYCPINENNLFLYTLIKCSLIKKINLVCYLDLPLLPLRHPLKQDSVCISHLFCSLFLVFLKCIPYRRIPTLLLLQQNIADIKQFFFFRFYMYTYIHMYVHNTVYEGKIFLKRIFYVIY